MIKELNEMDSTASIKSREQAVAHARGEARDRGLKYAFVSSNPETIRTGDGIRGYGITIKYDYFCTDEPIEKLGFITYEALK